MKPRIGFLQTLDGMGATGTPYPSGWQASPIRLVFRFLFVQSFFCFLLDVGMTFRVPLFGTRGPAQEEDVERNQHRNP